jgi:hypothetical protein
MSEVQKFFLWSPLVFLGLIVVSGTTNPTHPDEAGDDDGYPVEKWWQETGGSD